MTQFDPDRPGDPQEPPDGDDVSTGMSASSVAGDDPLTELYLRAKAEGFAGAAAEILFTELFVYGVAVTSSRILSGGVWGWAGTWAVSPGQGVREVLIRNEIDRLSLCSEVVDRAFRRWMADERCGQGYLPGGPASLKTWFYHRLAKDFANAFRTWRTAEQWREVEALARPARTDDEEQRTREEVERWVSMWDPWGSFSMPADIQYEILDQIERATAYLSSLEQEVIKLKSLDFSYAEIADCCDIDIRAVANALRNIERRNIRMKIRQGETDGN